jgi:hypothetical protein
VQVVELGLGVAQLQDRDPHLDLEPGRGLPHAVQPLDHAGVLEAAEAQPRTDSGRRSGAIGRPPPACGSEYAHAVLVASSGTECLGEQLREEGPVDVHHMNRTTGPIPLRHSLAMREPMDRGPHQAWQL